MKYSLCARDDGDTISVSAGGGGFSGDVNRGSAWSGGGNGGDRASSNNGGNVNNKPKRLFTGGPIIVVKDGLRYVGIIIDDDTDVGPVVDWRYDGSTDDYSSQQTNTFNKGSIPEFGVGSGLDVVRSNLEAGGQIVGPGLLFRKGKYMPRHESIPDYMLVRVEFLNRTYPVTVFCQVNLQGNQPVGPIDIIGEEKRYNTKFRRIIENLVVKRVNDYFQAQNNLAKNNFPSVFALRGTPSSQPLSANGLQFSVAGGGAVTVSDVVQNRLGQLLSEFWSSASRIATASTAGPITAALSLLTYSSKVGVGSDKVPGRDYETMFSMPVRNLPGATLPDNLADIASKKGIVNLPVRAAFIEKNGKKVLNVFKTGNTHVPASVRVLAGEFDKDTGTFRVGIDGVPPRIILESPAKAPGANVGNTASPQPDYKIPAHTGIDVKPVDKLTVTTTPIAEPVEFFDYIIWTPTADGTGVEPIYVVLSRNPYGGTEKGKYSQRYYNPDKAGGPILDLDWKNIKFDRAGVDKVKLHTGRFGESAGNRVMIDRLEKILKGELPATDTDKRFYTHEIRELERYRNLGIKDDSIPKNHTEVWNNTHTATLEDYRVNEKNEPLYTQEAEDAYRKAEEEEGR